MPPAKHSGVRTMEQPSAKIDAESASATSAPTKNAITGAATIGGMQLNTMMPTVQSDLICSSAQKHALAVLQQFRFRSATKTGDWYD